MATTSVPKRRGSAAVGAAADEGAPAGAGAGTRWTRVRRIVGAVALAGIAGATVGAPWWGPRALARLDYFHVRRIEFDGIRYTKAPELIEALQVDTTQSVWQPLEPLAARLAANPLVASVVVERRLPGTVVVHVVEREPVALVPMLGRLQPSDAGGRPLPINPAMVPLDVPIASSADSALLALLDGLRRSAPELYARVTYARRASPQELRVELGPLTVRTMPEVTVARFKDILPVEADLARNRLRVVELDLRFRDQVIARQP